MRVAVITQRFPTSEEKWAGHSGYQTLRILAKRHDVHVFYPEAVYPPFMKPAGKRGPTLDRQWNPDGVATTYIPFPVIPIISRPVNGVVMANHLLPHIRRFMPDILLNYFIYPDGFATVRVARALRIPAVLTATGADIHSITDPLARRMTSWTLRNADFVSTVSSDLCVRARILGADASRSRPKLNGCDTTIFYPQDRLTARRTLGLDPSHEIVVYVGRLDIRKGLLDLIASVAQLAPGRPKLRCYIIGGGPDHGVLTDMIAKKNVAEYVTIVPSCPTDQVALWMAASNLVTLPSYNEGCPNVVIEALAAGRPVVATNVGGTSELMDDRSGRLLPPGDIPALTAALDQVLAESWDAEAISTTFGRSWTDVADDLHQILEETLERRNSQTREAQK